MRFARRVDANQGPIVHALRAAGARVKVIHQPFDLQVWANATSPKCMYLEVKNPKTNYGRRGLNTKQQNEAIGLPVCVVDGVEAALRALNVLRSG